MPPHAWKEHSMGEARGWERSRTRRRCGEETRGCGEGSCSEIVPGFRWFRLVSFGDQSQQRPGLSRACR